MMAQFSILSVNDTASTLAVVCNSYSARPTTCDKVLVLRLPGPATLAADCALTSFWFLKSQLLAWAAALQRRPDLADAPPERLAQAVLSHINSGFTYREYDYLNNARQVAKLPDWAVVDLKVAPDAIAPGAVPAAGFFDEAWQFRAAK